MFVFLSTVPDSYQTIVADGEFIFRDRGSRFFGRAFALGSETEFPGQLDHARRQYPAARHYCFAWRLGFSGEKTRAGDDGEPSGTAGKPILGQIISAGLTNAGVIVIRYFGGTLLGTGGLIKAYRTAAEGAIGNAEKKVQFVMSDFRAVFSSEDMGPVMRLLRECDATIINAGYDNTHSLDFSIKKMYEQAVAKKFEQLYRVRLEKLTI